MRQLLREWHDHPFTKREWTTLVVRVPRCLPCRDAHERQLVWIFAGGLVGGLVCGLAVFATSPPSIDRWSNAGTVAAIGFIGLAAILGAMRRWLLPKGVKDAAEAKLHPTVLAACEKGYHPGVPE